VPDVRELLADQLDRAVRSRRIAGEGEGSVTEEGGALLVRFVFAFQVREELLHLPHAIDRVIYVKHVRVDICVWEGVPLHQVVLRGDQTAGDGAPTHDQVGPVQAFERLRRKHCESLLELANRQQRLERITLLRNVVHQKYLTYLDFLPRRSQRSDCAVSL
jgi:hypothetical protein